MPGDAGNRLQRAACLVMLDRFEESADLFRAIAPSAGSLMRDRTILYLRAQALFRIRTYLRARQTIDELAQLYPRTRLAKRGQEIAIEIDRAMAEGVRGVTLNWYLDQGLQAYGAARAGLAAEYLEEYLLLADKVPAETVVDQMRARLALAGACVELGDPAMALRHLEPLPPETGEYKAGLLTAFALKMQGRTPEAISALRHVRRGTQDEWIRTSAAQHLEQWTAD